ncbi:YcaO-like family protein [Streptomyces sp. NPDC096105]|uniref:YcaO-like family protein n=1 Tax=Streptomyces sp. NPDC096105 TaxID=3366074 RepID=UPI0038029896
MKKVHFDGTHRVRRPEETWALIDGLRGRFGITRVADVTGLDILGIPVVMAVRPAAKTLTVSQGKGTCLLLARVSAIMESVELWHAEYACPAPEVRKAPAFGLDLPYDVRDLQQHHGSLLTDRTLLDWVVGADALTGAQTLVPRSYVTVDHQVSDAWQPPLLHGSTNGLASGNSYDEAVTHALYEVIERDCTAGIGAVPVAERRHVDPATVDDPLCAEVLSRITAAGVWVEIVDVPNRWGLPCFVTYIWSEDFPALAVGSGVHASPAVALSRAVTESAQSRLTAIAGSRDDLAAALFPNGLALPGPPPVTEGETVSWRDVPAVPHEFAEDTDEARWLAEEVSRHTGRPPVVVDLSTESEFSVVKVVAAGLEFDGRHEIPRPLTASASGRLPQEIS